MLRDMLHNSLTQVIVEGATGAKGFCFPLTSLLSLPRLIDDRGYLCWKAVRLRGITETLNVAIAAHHNSGIPS